MFQKAEGRLKGVEFLIELGTAYGWERPIYQGYPHFMLSLFKDGMRVNIYTTTMTVGTCLDHPLKGKTQLFRRNCSIEDVERIFNNPRVHTRKGYY